MLNDLVKGVTKFIIINNTANGVGEYRFVSVGDLGTYISSGEATDNLLLSSERWHHPLWFNRNQLEFLEEPKRLSPDLIIYKSRWDEIINNFSKPLNFMTREEVEVVKSILKTNVPFNVVEDPVVIDPVIKKEGQTHLDANYVGVGRNGCFYYRSDILKQWFYWNKDSEWGECDFNYNDVVGKLPVSFGESK